MWYYGCYHHRGKYIVITAPFKTEEEAWEAFQGRDKYIRKEYPRIKEDLWGSEMGTIGLNKYRFVEEGKLGWTIEVED